MSKILLKNGEIVMSKSVVEDSTVFRDILIEDGKIVDILNKGTKVNGAEEIDCDGKMILPGLIDAHIHMREPGANHKEDWPCGSKAAVASGVTTVCDMPNNTPPTTSVKSLDAKRELVKGRSYVNYGFYIGYDGENIDEVNDAKNIAGIKVYAANSTGDMGVSNEALEKLFEEANKLIVTHAEDESIIEKNEKEYLAEGIEPDASIHSKIRSPKSAESSVRMVCEFAKQYGKRLHIAHISTDKEIEIINKYDNVTCEVAPHHLLLSDDDYEHLGNLIKVNPPVRERMDLFSMWKSLKFGEIDIVATDHAPHTLEEKGRPYNECPSGIPELDTLGPIFFNAVNDEGMTIEELVRVLCERPAELFGIKNKGQIKEGYDADLVVVDMDMEKKIENKKLFTKCGWSPYDGSVLKGWPVMTIVNGEIVYKDGKIIGDAIGKEVEFI